MHLENHLGPQASLDIQILSFTERDRKHIPPEASTTSIQKFSRAQDLAINIAPTMTDPTRLKSTVYVGGLDLAVTTRTLHEAFVPFGEIAEVTLPKPDLPSNTDPHRGFGYVEFEHAADAKEAIDNMDQSELYGRVIKVATAKPQKDQNEGLGSKTAIWEQVCSSLFDLT